MVGSRSLYNIIFCFQLHFDSSWEGFIEKLKMNIKNEYQIQTKLQWFQWWHHLQFLILLFDCRILYLGKDSMYVIIRLGSKMGQMVEQLKNIFIIII